MLRTWAVIVALLLTLERAAVACPFCGGKGANGLLENLLLVAGLWFGARALMRAMKRRQQRSDVSRTPSPEDSASDPPS